VEEQAGEVIRKTKGTGLFLSSGCAMGFNTPPENLEALIRAAKEFGSREEILRIREAGDEG
ncbi:MAG: uroporphyrinogen decarboxylase, partial [Bacillota bacterium]